jgi:Na+-transporting NADH:ubiquinone oxidoreductase subunit A
MRDEQDSLQEGVNVLSKLTGGSIYVSLSAKDYAASPLYKLKNVKQYCFSGAHPAGNVGIQINHISPIAKGETAWTITPAGVAAIGKLFTKGIYDISRLFAIAGPRSEHPCYVKAVPGFCLKQISEYISETDCKIYGQPVGIRCISGNVLTGSNIGAEGYTGFYDNEVSFVSEGNYNELFGWAKIFRPKKFSMSHSYFSWLCPKRKYNADTNVNGGERAFVMSGLYEKVVPMDIYPVYLIKAILAEDIDKMEQLGIYEVLEEDFALCEYICPSKINVQDIISRGISLMMKEMA